MISLSNRPHTWRYVHAAPLHIRLINTSNFQKQSLQPIGSSSSGPVAVLTVVYDDVLKGGLFPHKCQSRLTVVDGPSKACSGSAVIVADHLLDVVQFGLQVFTPALLHAVVWILWEGRGGGVRRRSEVRAVQHAQVTTEL